MLGASALRRKLLGVQLQLHAAAALRLTATGSLHAAPAAHAAWLSSTTAGDDRSQALHVGEQYSRYVTFTASDVDSFLTLTGDANPVHRSHEAATAAGLPGPLLPGAMMSSLFPAIIGSAFPGALYASQTVSFRAAARVGQPVLAQVTVRKRSRAWVVFHTCCKAADGTLLVEGEAMAKMQRRYVAAADGDC